MRIRPGDVFAAEVIKAKPLNDNVPPPMRDKIRIITAIFYIRNRDIPYYLTCSFNVEKWGVDPKPGDILTVRLGAPRPRSTEPANFGKGEFYITGITPKEERPTTMPSNPSRDRIQFTLGYSYLQHSRIYPVLEKAFGIAACDVKRQYRSTDDITIVCRPSQFARFLIFRNAEGITNGFKDLHAKLYVPEPETDIYTKLAEIAEVDRCAVKKIANALAYSAGDLESRYAEGYSKPRVFDVSKNRYQPD